jgi:hypothetical protein
MSMSRERGAVRKGVPLILAILVAVAAAFAGGVLTERSSPGSEAAVPTRPRSTEGVVFVYGDSLVVQSEPYLDVVAKSLGMSVTVHAFGGIAPCDAEQWLAGDLQQEHPSIVVLAFSGNSLTECMRDKRGELLSGKRLVAKYRADIERSVSLATRVGVPVVVASPPAAENRAGSWQQLDAMYRDIAAARAPLVQYLDAGTEIAPGGAFSASQRCLPFEVSVANGRCAKDDGGISVRARDGVHFCAAVVDPVSNALSCPGYSSGAMRYAITLVSAARLDLDYFYFAAEAVASGVSR